MYDGLKGKDLFLSLTPASSTAFFTPRTKAKVNIADNDKNIIFNIENFSALETTERDFNGDASISGSSVKLTPASTYNVGSYFLTTPVEFSSEHSFEIKWQARISGGTGDGMTLILNNNSSGTGFIGGNGGSIGYITASNSGTIAIALRTHTNDDLELYQNGSLLSSYSPSFNFDSKVTFVWLDYSSADNALEVYLSTIDDKPDLPVLSYTIDLFATLGADFFLGFSAGTGASSANHFVDGIYAATWE